MEKGKSTGKQILPAIDNTVVMELYESSWNYAKSKVEVDKRVS